MRPDFIDALLPDGISDETAVELCNILSELAVAFENRLYAQLHRYYRDQREEQFDLFDSEQPWSNKPPAF